jgi:hypothetical protein
MVVNVLPLVWRTFSEEYVELRKGGTVATAFMDNDDHYLHVTTGVELTESRHYWEVEVLSENINKSSIYVGIVPGPTLIL